MYIIYINIICIQYINILSKRKTISPEALLFTDGGVDAEGVPKLNPDTDEGFDEDPTLKPPPNENPAPPASTMVGAAPLDPNENPPP